MKITIFLLISTPLVLAGIARPPRLYLPEENDPDFKRFIYVPNEKEEYELVDLRAAPSEIQPRVGLADVEYDLYTTSNKNSPYVITGNKVDSLKNSPFDPSKITMFVCHGWKNNRNSEVNKRIREAIFAGNHDVNLIIVDWSGPAGSIYMWAKDYVVPVGQIVGGFINEIQASYGIDGSSFVLAGHSLGAHVAGNAGKTVNKKIGHIIGLDPAGPLFSLNRPEERLDSSDATFVQVIHTNGKILGLGSSIGDADYYPNGGMSQPGCGWDLAGTCAHSKAYMYLAEAISRGSVFPAVLCPDYDKFKAGGCTNNLKSTMGQIKPNMGLWGTYYLETNADEPFGLA